MSSDLGTPRRPASARVRIDGLSALSGGLAVVLLALLVVPVVALALASSPADLVAGVRDPLFAPALSLSLRTTLVSLLVVVITGTPLSWWLASSRLRLASVVALLVDLPVVIPPAVVGVALLETFGRRGLFGPELHALGVSEAAAARTLFYQSIEHVIVPELEALGLGAERAWKERLDA